MKVFVGLVSSNDSVCQTYSRQRAELIPKEHRIMGAIFYMSVFNPSKMGRVLEDYLLKEVRGMDAAILLVEGKYEYLVEKIKNAFFMAILPFDEFNERNSKNYWASKLARLLKNYKCLLDAMQRSDNEQVMILPVRNFNSEHLRNLAQTCINNSISKDFNGSIGLLISELKDKKRPRRKTKDKTMYIVDDEEKCFEYGKERHAKFPTGSPHSASCEINGYFRFGKGISTDRHFNVSKEAMGGLTKISGDFRNCHNEKIYVKETTHLNMFSNDYF
ncbi:MAG: hypothetical protein NTX45_26735 [Proteobacteria bacterium]|nr:hypothetical protein [Pseudomonadota bacterium]